MKNILATITATVLGLTLLGGFGFIMAHEGNSGTGSVDSDRVEDVEIEDIDDADVDVDNSGPGSLNSGRDELRLEDEDAEDVDMAEFRLREDGEFRVENSTVTKTGTDSFEVLAQGVTFKVKVSAGTEFEGGSLAGIMVGDVVREVKGTLDATDHHLIMARELDFDEEDED